MVVFLGMSTIVTPPAVLQLLLAVEEFLEQILHLGDVCGVADDHDVVHIALVHLSVADALLHRLHALAK
ncbi:hypothetical protein GUJ93_ZPchr0009g975 [Zizania palustris]|uniref:Uncharacterized protein n=1 Tax=Zizania palustris TaxID=103762 RepID=A0A8J5R8H5_ZIZPA|nr:hypothetical protein GUJ93_ZPchr0009g975 [Zizania palustris]